MAWISFQGVVNTIAVRSYYYERTAIKNLEHLMDPLADPVEPDERTATPLGGRK